MIQSFINYMLVDLVLTVAVLVVAYVRRDTIKSATRHLLRNFLGLTEISRDLHELTFRNAEREADHNILRRRVKRLRRRVDFLEAQDYTPGTNGASDAGNADFDV